MRKLKDTMSPDMTELLQDKAKEPVKEKGERLIFRWQEEDESPADRQAEREKP